jgi:hypothetical protein
MCVWLGGVFLWQGRSGLLYHTPIYFKGPTWLDPWQAIIGGALFVLLGLIIIVTTFRQHRGD